MTDGKHALIRLKIYPQVEDPAHSITVRVIHCDHRSRHIVRNRCYDKRYDQSSPPKWDITTHDLGLETYRKVVSSEPSSLTPHARARSFSIVYKRLGIITFDETSPGGHLMSFKTAAQLFTTLIATVALTASAYAHCGSCGAGEKTKEHDHGDAHAECIKKCDSATDKDSCKKGCDGHHKAADAKTEKAK